MNRSAIRTRKPTCQLQLLTLEDRVNPVNYSVAGSTYTQNFDGLPNTATSAVTGNGPFDLSASPINATGMSAGDWFFMKSSGTGSNAVFLVGTGSGNQGAVYSYGDVPSGERALGSLASGTVISRFGTVLTNNTGQILTSFTINYNGEQWRRGGGSANVLAFSYRIGASSINDPGTFTNVTSLDFTSPIVTGSDTALNGNLAANRVARTATITGISWANGQSLTLRWQDTNDAANDDGLAIDDFTFVANGAAPSNNAPTLTGAEPLATIAEDVAPASNTGTLVSTLIAGKVSDPDAGALSGIAVTAVDNTNGTWEYSTNGSTWNSLAGVTASAARLLTDGPSSRVRFVPASDFNGTVSNGITFRAWDQTSGTAGATANTTTNGGATAFSSATASSSITVTAVNDAPTNTMPGNFSALSGSTVTFSGGRLISIADVDAGSNPVQVSLSVSAGTLTLNGSSGLNFTAGSATNSASMIFTGTLSAINTALNGMTFAAPNSPTNVTLTMNTNDQGNTGSGNSLSDSDTLTITVFDGLFINEVLFNPNGTDTSLEYVEIRGKPNEEIPNGVYFVGIEGDEGSTPGTVQTIFNLSGLTLGSNGYLVFLQHNHPYTVDPAASVFVSNATGFSGLPLSMFTAETGTDIENTSATFMLIQTTVAPQIGNDIDANNDGTPDGSIFPNWDVLDAVGAIDASFDISYAPIVFTNGGGIAPVGAVFVDIGTAAPEYVGRTSDTTGSAASDWVGGDTVGSSPNWTLAVGQTAPALYGGAALDHIGSTNFPTVGVNQAPVNTVPAAQTIPEDGSRVFNSTNGNLISISDSDAGTNAVQVSLTATNGTMTLSGNAGLNFTVGGATASAAMVFTGTISDINTALAGMTFNATPNVNGVASIQIVTNDLGNTGTGGAKSDTDSVTINITPVNDEPSGVNAGYTINEDTTHTFTTAQFNLTDASDSPANTLLAVRIASLATQGTLIRNGVNVNVGDFISATDIGNGLFTYTPEFNGNGSPYATFTFQVQDNGGTANGGIDLDSTPNTFTFNVQPVNDAPTAIALQNVVATLAENSNTTAPTKLADIVITDDEEGTNTIVLSGADASFFEVNGTALRLKAGVSLNFEAKSSYSITISVDDTNVGVTPDASVNYTLTITDVNEAPTALTLTNTTTTLAENTNTATAIHLSDIVITDDAMGTNTLSLSGPDLASFEIVGGSLRLKAGTTLDYETKSSYTVNVEVDDTNVGNTPDVSTTFTLTITDVNEAPTAITLTNTITSLPENTSTPSKVADIVVTDDAMGTNTLSLVGADEGAFEIVGSELRVKSGVSLNFEAKTSYSVTVRVDDTSVGATPDGSINYTLTITDVNEAPTAVTLANTTTSLSENTSTTTAIHLADIIVTDDAMGTNTLTPIGADAVFFEIVGTVLRLKAGVDLDATTKPSYTFAIHVDDPSVGATPDLTVPFTLTILPNQLPVLTRNTEALSGAEGNTLTNSGTVADGDSNTVSLSASAGTVVNNGDGTWSWSLALTDGPLAPTTVIITGNDGFGGIGTTTFTYAATNVAPTATGIAGPTVRQIGASGTYSLTGVDDPGSADVSSLRYSFALTTAGLAANYTVASVANSATFNFPTGGTRTVYARVYDKDGGVSTTQQLNVLVANLPPTATITTTLPPTTPAVIVRNLAQSFTVSDVVDAAQTNANFTIKWDWDGDGVMDPEDFVQSGLPYGSPPQTRSFNFPTLGLRTVKITVSDDGSNAATTYNFPVDVRATALQPNGELWVAGTAANNIITLSQGPTAGSVRVVLDNVVYGPFGSTQTPLTAVRIFGQAGTDTITFAGSDGNDVFEILDDVTANTLRDKEFTFNGLPVSTLNVESYALKGGNGDDTFRVRGTGSLAPNTSNVFAEGGMGADRLVSELALADVGNNGRTDWTIEGPQRGRLETNLTFNWIEELTGNALDDYFTFLNGASMPSAPGLMAGVVGGAGTNTMDMSASTTAVNVIVTGPNTLNTSQGPAMGINHLIASNATTDRITGFNDDTLWTITAPQSGNYILNDDPPVSFAGFEVVVGGTADDFFDILPNGSLGLIDGGSGSGRDELSYSTWTANTPFTVSPPTAPNLGSWSGMEAIEGGQTSNRLTAANGANTWTISGENSGTLNTLAFAGFDSLVGGTSTDLFLLQADGDIGTISGGSGTNTLSYAGSGSPVSVTLGTTSSGSGTRVGFFNGISSLVGGSGLDTLVGTGNADTILVTATHGGTINTSTGFSAFENLHGGQGHDTFRITTTSLPLAITSLVGGLGNDTLMGANRTNQFVITNTDTGTLNLQLGFTSIEHLTGGSGADSFAVSHGSLSGVFNGGGGTDTLNVGTSGSVNLLTNTSVILGVTTAFVGIENFVATNGTFTGANTSNIWRLTGWDMGTLNSAISFSGFGTINGGNQSDRLQVYKGGVTGTFNAGDGSDILDYAGVTMPRPYTTFNGTLANGQFRTGLTGNPLMNLLSFEIISGNIYA